MAIVKSHLCNSCGGLLDIDIDRQIYICPFCGVTYDYEYFREDNVIDIATRALTRSEFGSAREAYEFIIKKDPHNFEALRGLFLCSCKWKTISPIINSEKVYANAGNPALTHAIESCLPEHKEYFESIRKALEILKEYRQNLNAVNKLEDDKEATEKRIRAIYLAREKNSKAFADKLRNILDSSRDNPFTPIIVYFSLLGIVGLAFLIMILGWQMLIACAGVLIAAIVIYNVRKALINKSLDAALVPVREKADKISSELDVKNNHGKDLMEQYRTLSKKILMMDHKLHKAPSKEDEDN